MRHIPLVTLAALPLLVLGGCAPQKTDEMPLIGMPNPASVHCGQAGGRTEIRTGKNGEYGVCVFSDGRQCEEWALFRDQKCVAPVRD